VNGTIAQTEATGAKAVLAMRFGTSERDGSWAEICADGTPVAVERLG